MIRSRLTSGAVAVLATTVFGIPQAAPAAANHSAASEEIGVQACSLWMDYAYGRGRAHASCPGVYVTVRVYCANESSYTSKPFWRDGYNKAECPAGVGAMGMNHSVML